MTELPTSSVAVLPTPQTPHTADRATTARILPGASIPEYNMSKSTPVMDEKHAPMPPPIRRGLSPFRLVAAVAYLALVAFTYWHFNTRATLLPADPLAHSEAPATKKLVPLEAHIMSKCPDAKVSPMPVLAAASALTRHRTASATWCCRQCRRPMTRSTLRCRLSERTLSQDRLPDSADPC